MTQQTTWIHGDELGDLPDLWTLLEAAMVEHAPRPAVRDLASGRALTFGELLTEVEATASGFDEAGLSAGDTVLVGCGRGVDEIVAVLAAVRQALVYVGIDPDGPDHHLHAVSSAACARAIVIGERQPGAALEHLHQIPSARPSVANGATSPATGARRAADDYGCYLSFTSGSTGEPKGVLVPRRAVSRLVAGAGAYLLLDTDDAMLRLAPLAFDASTLEIFAPLAVGATLTVFPRGPSDPREIARAIEREGIDVAWLTAALFDAVVHIEPGFARGAKQILSGGDVVSPGSVRALLAANPGIRFTNGYGPTENTTFTTTWSVEDLVELDGRADVPIGLPVPGTSVTIDPLGELVAAGVGLALGYIGATSPEDAARFADLDGVPVYRTGDRVQVEADEQIHYRGRFDRQVKVSGHRIDLAAIEDGVRSAESARDCVVLALSSGDALREICCAVTVRAGANDAAALAQIKAHVAHRFAAQAVPTRWLVLDTIPFTTVGKPDRDALAGLFAADVAPATEVADHVSTTVRALWERVLATDDFDDDERFFEVGGDSVLLVELFSLLQETYAMPKVRIVDLFSHPTVEEMVALISDRASVAS